MLHFSGQVIRATTYSMVGQRVECWLPAGQYESGSIVRDRTELVNAAGHSYWVNSTWLTESLRTNLVSIL